MTKAKVKLHSRVTTVATSCNSLTHCTNLSHPCSFDKVATGLPQVATFGAFLDIFCFICLFASFLQVCRMSQPYLQLNFLPLTACFASFLCCKAHE